MRSDSIPADVYINYIFCFFVTILYVEAVLLAALHVFLLNILHVYVPFI